MASALTVAAVPRVVRCGIYTRKSTTEGLDQQFNSLMAQREAAEAYIASQREQGWSLLDTHYDDGGCSGASMDRPALAQLLAAVNAGEIDCVVVYKVDRLSRSLLDFARIMSILDARGTSFVSVTQQFNTSVPLGRLTLNILLSFAQFERELIGERTRDKILAARRRGQWTGGTPPLGYDIAPGGGHLLVNETEAGYVRQIFTLFTEMRSLTRTLAEIERRGWKTKAWKTSKGVLRSAKPFHAGALRLLLANVLYAGYTRHQGERLEANHPGIIDRALFERAQEILSANKTVPGKRGAEAVQQALLAGALYCELCGKPMAPVHVRRGTKLRSYRCSSEPPCGSVRAARIHAALVEHLRTDHAGRNTEPVCGADIRSRFERISFDPVTHCLFLSPRAEAITPGTER